MNRNIKAQMKMMESILVLIIFFFLLIFGLVFYAKFQAVQSKKDVAELAKKSLKEISQRIQYMSELQCSKDGTYIEGDCFDKFKLTAFMDSSADNWGYYSKLFPNSKIVIHEVFPQKSTWEVYDQSVDPEFDPNSGGESFYLPVNLFDPRTNEYHFGYINISIYYFG